MLKYAPFSINQFMHHGSSVHTHDSRRTNVKSDIAEKRFLRKNCKDRNRLSQLSIFIVFQNMNFDDLKASS